MPNYTQLVKLMAHIEEFVDAKIQYAQDSQNDSHEHFATHEQINRARTALIDYAEEMLNERTK